MSGQLRPTNGCSSLCCGCRRTPREARANVLFAGTDGDFIVRRLEAFDTMAALDLYADGECVSRENASRCSISLPNWVSAGLGSRYVHRDESMLL